MSGHVAPSGARYKRTRPRGMAPWSPQPATMAILKMVLAVLEEYAEHLPLTVRQIFYRLVGAHGYDKTERAYNRLAEYLVRARRAGIVPFEAIRDDGGTVNAPHGFASVRDFWGAVRHTAHTYRRHRDHGQAIDLELWVEASGMVPQIARVAHHYGAAVYSASGFDSVTGKREAANRIIERTRPTVILHVGDHDPSGLSVYDAAAEDVAQFTRDLGSDFDVTPRRIAVTPEQIDRYALPGAPRKDDDNRGDWQGETVQAEALTPDQLAAEVRAAIEAELDLDALADVIAAEEREREALTAEVARMERDR
jgi:hypothetical protein